MFTDYYSISPGMISQIPGKGSNHLVGFTDREGKPLSGGVTIDCAPANVPAAKFWSVTHYQAENGSGLANGQPFPSLGSRDSQSQPGRPPISTSAQAPTGKEANWLATLPGGDIHHPPALRTQRSRPRQ